MYYEANNEHALRYQKLVKVCSEKDINSERALLGSKWRDLELEEFLKEERHNERMDRKMAEAARRAKWRLGMGQFDTDQTSIESKE
ncbi:hypothetical protein Hanom_Chr03g00211481 [Helianthus anomalus]